MSTFPSAWQKLNVVLAHDWLTGMRGGERVLEILCRAFPQAPIFTLFADPKSISAIIREHRIITSPLQRIPGIFKFYRNLLPFFPTAMASLRPGPADIVISTSHCVAKGLTIPKGARHLCYCFTPMRYAWGFYEEYFGRNPLKRAVLAPMLRRLRRWDKASAARVDHFVTLSRHVQKRVGDFYGREADVVYPPVDLSFWEPEQVRPSATDNPSALLRAGCSRPRRGRSGVADPGYNTETPISEHGFPDKPHNNYDLVVSALVPYKRIDLAIKVYNQLGYPLKIVGSGPERKKLAAMANKNIEFTGHVSDIRLCELYQRCRSLIFPGEEDFGMVPVEAQACGRPVVAYAKGGARETIVEGQSGIFFNEQSECSLLEAVRKCAARQWDAEIIRKNAERFSEQNFIDGLAAGIEKCMRGRW